MSSRQEKDGKSPSESGGRSEGGGTPEATPGKSTLTAGAPTPGGPVAGNAANAALPTNGAQPASNGAVKLKVETDKASADGKKNRTTVGVGERVFIEPDPTVDGKFKSDAGKGKQDGVMYNWDAPDKAATATITFTPKDGGTPATVVINVIEPTSADFMNKKVLSYGNVSAAGMKVKIAFKPFTVSFANLDWQEKDVDPTVVEGWFKSQPATKTKHKKGPGGYLDADNKADDTAEWASDVVVKEKSKLQWDIPQHYKVASGDTISAEKPVPNQPFTQLMTIDADGTTTVSKNGESVTRKPG